MKLFPSFVRWRLGIFEALTRFPWNILCGVSGAAAIIVSIHYSRDEWLVGQCGRLAMTAAIGMPLFFSLRMVRERSEQLRRWPIEIIGLLLLMLWFFTQPPRPFDAPNIVVIRWLLLLAALHFFAAISLHVRRAESPGFWQFNRRLFLRFCLATLYTGVLTIGLELALLSADRLFQLKIDKLYVDLFFVMIGIFHPIFFLAGVPRDFSTLDTDTEYPRGLKAFTQLALAPLVAVYTGILYAYAVKIIVTRTWPQGWVALPVLILSGVGIFAFLFLSPLRGRTEEKWAVWFTRNFPRALAPLAILLLLSVRVRIVDYGVTEERYLGVVAGIWIFIWGLSFIIRKNAGIRWIPVSLSAICLIAVFGPWSAGEVSKSSQLRRIEHLLKANGLWANNRATSADRENALSGSDRKDLENILDYLIRVHGGQVLKRLFTSVLPNEDWKALKHWRGVRDVITALNLEAPALPMTFSSSVDSSPREAAVSSRVTRMQQSFLDVNGYRRVWRVSLYGGLQSEWRPSVCDGVKIGQDHGVLKIATTEKPMPKEIPLEKVFNNVRSRNDTELADDKLTVDFQNGAHVFRIVFDSISFAKDSPVLQIDYCSIYLLEK